MACWAEEQVCKLKWERKWENLSKLDWLRESEWGQEAEANRVWLLGGEISKEAEGAVKLQREYSPKEHVKLRYACAKHHHSFIYLFMQQIYIE